MELFQRQGQSAYELSRAHRYHLELHRTEINPEFNAFCAGIHVGGWGGGGGRGLSVQQFLPSGVFWVVGGGGVVVFFVYLLLLWWWWVFVVVVATVVGVGVGVLV